MRFLSNFSENVSPSSSRISSPQKLPQTEESSTVAGNPQVQFALGEDKNMFINMFGPKGKLQQARAFHKKIKSTGYNQGYSKGGFVR